MKILHFHTSMGQGGIEAIICGLVNNMSLFHDVSLCTIFAIDNQQIFEKTLSPKVKRHTLDKVKPGFSFKEVFRIIWFIRQGKYDIVHIHGFFYYYFLAIMFLHNKVHFVYTIHSDAKKENSGWDKYFFPLKRYAFQHKWIHPVTISKESQRSFTKLYHTTSTLIYNGVAAYTDKPINYKLNEFRHSPETLIFLHPGRISEAKNQIVLCQVFDRLIKEGRDVVLLIAGSNDDANIFQKISQYFSDKIVYLGERADIRDLFCVVDAFCLPSIWEGMPVTLLEAISVGCIPICSPVGGIPEIITDGVSGFLSTDSTINSYYDAVLRFIKLDDNSRKIMSQKCKQAFTPFSIDNIAKLYMDLYERMLTIY